MTNEDVDKTVKSSNIKQELKDIKKDFEIALGITAIHKKPDIHLNYNFISLKHPHTAKIKVIIPENDPKIDTSTDIFPANDWHEREVYDLMGVNFVGHKNLRRIFMPDDWVGSPLRKDYAQKYE
jgi:NADH-quinone oxidoreductase subunit C